MSKNFPFSSSTEEKLSQLLNSAMEELQAIPQKVQGPDPKKIDAYKKRIKEVGEYRGRALAYPFIGSGRGHGAYVELEDGSVKLDLINGIGVHIMGHSHPRIIEASLRSALSDVVMQGNLEPNREYGEFSETILNIAKRGSRLKHVWLSTCGTMANENALKACRQKNTPARMVLAMNAAFAGRSTMMAEVTDNPALKVGLPDYNEVLRVPFYDNKDPQSAEKSLRILKEHVAKHEDNISCFSFEPMQGEGGFKVAPREYFLPMFEFCREKGIGVWADEVQTFMRTGEFFAFQTLDLGDYIDVCSIAKTAQTGATFYTEEYNPKPGLISGTFSGSSVSLNAGNEIMKILDKESYMGPEGKIAAIHQKFVGMLNKLNETTCKGLLTEAGGLGLMVAVVPLDGSKEKAKELQTKLYENGLISFGCGRGPFKIRFLLPAILTDADIATAGSIIEKSILELA